MKRVLFCFVLLAIIINSYAQSSMQLLKNIQAELSNQKGFFAIAFKDLQTNETLLWNEHEIFHAASTMKTPVMMEVYKQVAAGKLVLTDSILVKNEFKSIVDGSTYSLNAADDSQQELYKLVGSKIPLSELVYQMIIMSSNLATNLIMEMVDGKKVTQTMRDLGTKNMMVLRGVEDSKAFAQNLNNTTTAYDLMVVYEQLAKGKVVSQKACDDMINTLFNQTHNTLIPALLPKNVRVAHKTGTITGVHHDSGIVFLPDGRKYVLVFLSKNLENDTEATNAMARVSEMIYRKVISKTN
jgi:beta-lactamase class A